MKFLFASDSFKGTLTSYETSVLLESAARAVFPDCETDRLIIADGGEGTMDALIAAEGGAYYTIGGHDPLGRPILADFGLLPGNRAIVEMAAASGLTLLKGSERDPLRTSTYGTGELIGAALNEGARDITVAIGGSATNDGGLGCLKALGARLLDQDGNELEGLGEDLLRISSIDVSGLDRRLKKARITVMCDVTNPLCGPDGATYTYGPQKGADSAALALLEAGMENWRDLIKRDFGADCDRIPGAGAAGGLGAALHVFLGGDMQPGIEAVLRLCHFDDRLAGCDLVVTGEGRTDLQSSHGKVLQGVGEHAAARGVPVIALSGSRGEGYEKIFDHGVTALLTVAGDTVSVEDSMARAKELYHAAALKMFLLVRDGTEHGAVIDNETIKDMLKEF